MTDKPLVTVVIPSFNHANYISNCIESVIEQTYNEIEIIIVDDNSSDETYNIAQLYSNDFRCKVFKNNQNIGVSGTLNKLIELSNGKYICFLASDDLLPKDSVEKRISYLQRFKDKTAVFGDCEVIDEDGVCIYKSGLSDLYSMKKSNLTSNTSLRDEIIINWGVPGGTLMVEKCFFDGFEFSRNNKLDDLEIFFSLVNDNKLVFLDEKLSYYRLHSHNTNKTTKNRLKMKLSLLYVLTKYIVISPFHMKLTYLKKVNYLVFKKIFES